MKPDKKTFYEKQNVLLDALQPTIKPFAEYSHGELGCEMLKWLALASIVTSAFVLPGSPAILKAFEIRKLRDVRSAQNTFHNLAKQGYLAREKNGYVLTPKGKERITKIAIHDLAFPNPKKWDGFWRIIMFDIPNTNKKQRDEFSWKVKDAGAETLQKSILVYPHACKTELDCITQHYFVTTYVDYLVATSVPNENQLIKTFNLSKKSASNLVPKL